MNASAANAVSRLETVVDRASRITDSAQLSSYTIAQKTPSIALKPGSAQEIVEIVKFAAAESLAIVPCAARTKLSIGAPPTRYDVALDLTRLNRIVAYDPGDLTLSVEPGVLLCGLQATLGERGQFLPHGAPFMMRATVGGTIAAGVEGPLRQMYGTTRDYVLGMEFVTGEGVLGKSGGRVVKNVTGYDLHKLMIGALGTLGVITKINFRTFPAPRSMRGFAVHFAGVQDAAACRDAVAASPLRPLTFEICSPSIAGLFSAARSFQAEPLALPDGLFSTSEWTLAASFEGTSAVLDRCEQDFRKLAEGSGATGFARIGSACSKPEMVVLGTAFTRLREFVPIALDASPACTIVKISVLPGHLEHALSAAKHAAEDHSQPWVAIARGVGVIYFALLPAARDEKSKQCVADVTNRIHADSGQLGGHSTIPWCPDEWKSALNIWGADRADLPLMQKLKSVFDPCGIFAPGRFFKGI
jgi:glycolate dehydrogenase FAD-binding subunit